MGKSNETLQNGDTEISITKIRDPEKERNIRCLRMSFLFPMIISLIFCVVDIMAQYKDCKVDSKEAINFLTWIISKDSLEIMLGYFTVTLITMAFFMFLQQFYFGVYAGLDENKAMTMLILAIVNLSIYSVYIGAFSDSYGMTLFMSFLAVLLGCYMWKSFNYDVRSISKYPSHKGGSKTFISPNC